MLSTLVGSFNSGFSLCTTWTQVGIPIVLQETVGVKRLLSWHILLFYPLYDVRHLAVVESFRIHMLGRLWVSLIIQSNSYCTNKLAKLLRFYYSFFVCCAYLLIAIFYFVGYYYIPTYMDLLICTYIYYSRHICIIMYVYIYIYIYIYICMRLPFKCSYVGVQNKMKHLPFRVLCFYL